MRIVKYLSSLLIISWLTSCTHTISSDAVNEKMLLIAPHVFVDKTMPSTRQQHFLNNLQIARQKIQRFFGAVTANPTVYACITPSCYHLFGGVKAKAKTYGDSQVLLTAEGLDHITLTHELAHIELHKRIGDKQAWHKIPMWFDEGLAVLIAEDPYYHPAQWQQMIAYNAKMNALNTLSTRRELNKLVTERQWISAVQQGQRPYGTAHKAVQNWYSTHGHQALEALILHMKQGKDFKLIKKNTNLFSKRP